jgi:osmotically-inducible protein OsmY
MRLQSDAFLVHWPIQVVEADDGLHLHGRVPTAEHADLAFRLAAQTVGVTKVVNELTVNP